MIYMAKFTKRLQKTLKSTESCVVLGTAFGNLDTVSELFNTVFIFLATDTLFKRRNVVYRATFDDVSIFPNVSLVLIDKDHVVHLERLKAVITRFCPLIYIGSGEFIDKEYSKILAKHRYEIIELFKDHQIWKFKT